MRWTPRFPAAVAGMAALMACPATSQQAPAKQQPDASRKTAQFTLPAGLHRMDELAQRLAMMRKQPLTLDEETRVLLHEQQVRMYGEMQLPQDALEDVFSSMLLTSGVVLGSPTGDTPTAKTLSAFRLAASPERPDSHKRPEAEARSPEELLARPANAGMVTTLIDTGSMRPMLVQGMLRPMLASATVGAATKLSIEDGKLRLLGTSDDVVCAVRFLKSMVDPDGASQNASAAATPDAASPQAEEAGTCRWPQGKRKLSEIGKLASESAQLTLVRRWPARPGGALADADALDPILDMGKEAMLTRTAWLARLSTVLADSNIAMTPLVPAHNIYELHTQTGSERKHYQQIRARITSPEQVLAQRHKLFVMTMEPLSVASNVAANMLRPKIAQWQGMSIGHFSRTHIMLSGRRDHVAEAIKILRDNK
ncbi:MAG: hypothetical protein AB8H80_16875 [Planctomycetota bacterium]